MRIKHIGLPLSKTCIQLFILFSVALFLLSCQQEKERKVQRSFYYWKSVFRLSAKENETLQQLDITQLYIKFFDVTWNALKQAPQPVATINFNQPPPSYLHITPVVFITNETISNCSKEQVPTLAENIGKLIVNIGKVNALNLSGEIQIDCDWTASTKEKYFLLLTRLKQHLLLKDKAISATIRLHQLKFMNVTGIPPVDKGLLMCYNMGNLRQAQVNNSIIDLDELKKYTNHLKTYPLQLDVALPLFDWFVWFKGTTYKGLIRSAEAADLPSDKGKIVFNKDTSINGFTFEKGDWLRYEGSSAKVVLNAARLINNRLSSPRVTVILYHLDESHLTKYNTYELENLFRSFR